MHSAVLLRPEPQAAGRARAWIRDQLTAMGHPELVDTAQLATSELVTNAVLHARTRITLAVSDDDDEVLIEVGDASQQRLVPTGDGHPGDHPDDSLPTVGNGLHIIGALARRWGVADHDDGKTVWFVPASPDEEALAAPRFPPDLLEGLLDQEPGTLDDLTSAGEPAVDVEVRDAPVRLLWESRFRVRDLRREMALLSLLPDDASTVPHRLVQVAEEVDHVRAAVLVDDEHFERAVAEENPSVTLRYAATAPVGRACARLADLLDEADDYCRDAQLLTLAAPPAERALRRWFLGEFARQTRGLPPSPWGAEDVEAHAVAD